MTKDCSPVIKLLYISAFTLIVIFLLYSYSAHAWEYTTTRIIVVEGKVICFDVPFEFAKEETILGKFIEKEVATETKNMYKSL